MSLRPVRTRRPKQKLIEDRNMWDNDPDPALDDTRGWMRKACSVSCHAVLPSLLSPCFDPLYSALGNRFAVRHVKLYRMGERTTLCFRLLGQVNKEVVA